MWERARRRSRRRDGRKTLRMRDALTEEMSGARWTSVARGGGWPFVGTHAVARCTRPRTALLDRRARQGERAVGHRCDWDPGADLMRPVRYVGQNAERSINAVRARRWIYATIRKSTSRSRWEGRHVLVDHGVL
jgi:hypothetical protein